MTLTWNTASCRDMYRTSLDDAPLRFDTRSGMLVPAYSNRSDGSKRHVTWEDTLNRSQVFLRKADQTFLEKPRNKCSGPPLFCEHSGIPLAVGAQIRPLRMLRHPRNRSIMTIPIEKSASSSMKRLFGYRLLRHCPHTNARVLFENMTSSTACDFAGSYNWPLTTTRFAVVRNPFGRFLSSLNEHGQLVCTNPHCPLLNRARLLLRQYQSPYPFEMRLFPPGSFIHQYTQSYFLSATDMRGNPVSWTHIYRLEETPILPANMTLPHLNKKSSYDHILRFVTRDPELRCSICNIYRQDFVCLGYDGCHGC